MQAESTSVGNANRDMGDSHEVLRTEACEEMSEMCDKSTTSGIVEAAL